MQLSSILMNEKSISGVCCFSAPTSFLWKEKPCHEAGSTSFPGIFPWLPRKSPWERSCRLAQWNLMARAIPLKIYFRSCPLFSHSHYFITQVPFSLVKICGFARKNSFLSVLPFSLSSVQLSVYYIIKRARFYWS